MNCPLCRGNTRVTNSREADQGRAIKRRRICEACGRRFTTYERLELLGLEVVKRDGSREPYYRHKLEAGIRKATEKRPFTEEQLQRLVSGIENDLFELEQEVVESERIGRITLAHLQRFDKVAYIRYASVYRNFRSTRAFEKEIQRLEKTKEKVRVSSPVEKTQ